MKNSSIASEQPRYENSDASDAILLGTYCQGRNHPRNSATPWPDLSRGLHEFLSDAMSDETRRIIIRREGKEFGPYTRAEAMRYLDDGSLMHTDEARLDGESASWRSLATLLGVSAPPPPPPFSMPTADQSQSAPGDRVADEELLRLFVGPNYDYYGRKWKVLEAKQNTMWSWNWAGFVFGLGWLFYRKMYPAAWIVVGIAFLILVFELTTGTRSVAIDFLIAVACGGIGNYLYHEHCQRKLRKIVPSGVADETLRLRIAREGGTNIAAGIIPTAIWLLLNIVALLALTQ